jgi:long-subunit fatty acid transport protein
MKKLVLALILSSALPVRAQLESPLLSKVQLNVVNPGGKSLAMGGAFVSLADDPTAAYANPAGLSQLSSWELGASVKGFRFEPKLTTDNFQETGPGSQAFDLRGVDEYRPRGTATELEFASIVIPVVQDFTIAAYRAVNLRYKLDASDLVGGSYRSFFVQRIFSDLRREGVSQDEFGGLDLRNEVYGISLGAKAGPVSFGGGITLNKLRYDLTGGAGGGHVFVSNIVNENVPNAVNPEFSTTVGADVTSGTKIGWLIGARFVADERHSLAIGAVYHKSPRFDVSYSISAALGGVDNPGAALASFSCGHDDPNIPGSGASACGSFRVPDDYSIGISGRPFPRLLLAFDVQRIRYSQLNDGFVPIFVYNPNSTTNRAIASATSDDGTLPRIGAEFALASTSTAELSLRAGYFHEPAHGTKALLYPDLNKDRKPDNGTPIDAPPFSQAYAATFDGGVAENHYSFGLGATFARRYSVDLAFDIAQSTKVGVLSFFARF